MIFNRKVLFITREDLFNYRWKKDHTQIENVRWESKSKSIVITDAIGTEYIIHWDDINQYILDELPDISKITRADWDGKHESIRIFFETTNE